MLLLVGQGQKAMHKVICGAAGRLAGLTGKFFDAVGEVLGFIRHGIDFRSDRQRAFERDLMILVEPHMRVLAHRREKLLRTAGQERWSDQLDNFMRTNLWPLLGEERAYADSHRIFLTLMLDVAIAQEQRRFSEPPPEMIPLVSRWDANWAS